MERLLIGVDPGNNGGAVVLGRTHDGWTVVRSFKLGRGEEAIAEFAKTYSGVRAFLEKVHGWGEGRSFAFGRYYGFVRGALVTAGCPIVDVEPIKWMRGMGVPPQAGKKAEHRQAMRLLAGQVQDEVEATNWNAAALLIAYWGARAIESGVYENDGAVHNGDGSDDDEGG
jgi:hypothetical protein